MSINRAPVKNRIPLKTKFNSLDTFIIVFLIYKSHSSIDFSHSKKRPIVRMNKKMTNTAKLNTLKSLTTALIKGKIKINSTSKIKKNKAYNKKMN